MYVVYSHSKAQSKMVLLPTRSKRSALTSVSYRICPALQEAHAELSGSHRLLMTAMKPDCVRRDKKVDHQVELVQVSEAVAQAQS